MKNKLRLFSVLVTTGVVAVGFWLSKKGEISFRAPASEVLGFGRFSDKHYVTLSPDQKIVGPLLKEQDPSGLETGFYSHIFNLTVHNAHHLVKHLYKAEDFESYKIFVLSALVISFHESFWSHFRALEPLGERCHESRNDGTYIEKIKSLSESETSKFKENFTKHFLKASDGEEGISPVVNCVELNKLDSAIQLIGTSDGIGFGIYQMSMRYGFVDEYFLPRKYLSVDDSILYGAELIYKGFNHIRKNQSKYECLFDQTGVLNKHNFIRGLWAGMFNGRGAKDICRFKDESNRWAKNDVNFHRDYLMFVNSKTSPILEHLSPREKAYFLDLVQLDDTPPLDLDAPKLPFPVSANQLNDKEYSNLMKGLVSSANDKEDNSIKEDSEGEKTETPLRKKYVSVGMLNLREGPSARTRIKTVLYQDQELEVLSDKERNGWVRVRVGESTGWVNSKFLRE